MVTELDRPEGMTNKSIPGLKEGKVIQHDPEEVRVTDWSLGKTYSFRAGIDRVIKFYSRSKRGIRVDFTNGDTATFRTDKVVSLIFP